MAKQKSAFKKIEETEDSGFGTYKESTGGGKPFSTSNTRTTRENGKYRKANNKTMQPRTSDGKFSYKSINGKSIDPKYGPSRGKTVNPLLTGGKNGIKIEDVEKQFDAKKGEIWDKYKDKWYRKGSESILGGKKDLRTKIAGESIWEIARQRYDEVNKRFGGKIEWDDNAKEWVATEEMSEEKVWSETKKGRASKEEVEAKKQAKKSGEQTFVSESGGGIKLRPGAGSLLTQTKKQYKPGWMTNLTPSQGNPGGGRWKPKMATPTMTTAQYQALQAQPYAPVQPQTQPVQPQPVAQPVQPQPQVAAQPVGTSSVKPTVAPKTSDTVKPALKHTADEFAALRKALVSAGELTQAEMDNISDDVLDANWDKLTN